MSARHDLTSGSELLGYRIERVIGRGGMGVVYLAHQLVLDRDVALKVLDPPLANDAAFRERFLRESRMAALLDHPAIVPVYDAGEVDGRLYIAMRFVEGGDLRALLDEAAPLDPTRALMLLEQVADALDAAHRSGLVHRDVKPGNVLVDGDRAYLADFGLTKQSSEAGVVETSHRAVSADYVAPELIEGGAVTAAADVYSLGCVLYECLCGTPPFRSDTAMSVLYGHLEHQAAPPTTRHPGLPAAIDSVVGSALAKEPEARPESCTTLMAEARAALGLDPARPRGTWMAALVVGLAVTIAVVAGFLLRRDGEPAPSTTPAVDSAARLDPTSGKIVSVVPVGGRPTAIAAGGRAVWTVNTADGTVSTLDARTGAMRRTVRVEGLIPADALAAIAADGDVAWIVTGVDGDVFVTRLGDTAGAFPPKLRVGAGDPVAVAIGEGAVWVVGKNVGRNVITKIDPRRGRVVGRVTVAPGETVTDLAVGEGSVWFTDWQREESLTRLDPKTLRVTGTLDVTGDDSIALGAGSVWLADIENGTVSRVDVRTMKHVTTLEVFAPPFLAQVDLAFGADALWLAYTEGPKVYRIDPASNDVSATTTFTIPGGNTALPPGPNGIAVSPDGVWVTLADQ